ncbi:MAG: hypothetical protein LBP23_07080 [Treponema sp.]|jgi:hypothetical protein|nr:hypothetical protein [Treponema sp.]
MASQKKPSIYSDRSTIGSSDELDEYGVWVKSEPQDLSSANMETRESSAPDMEDLPDFDTGFAVDAGFGDIPEEENTTPEPAEVFDDSGLDIPDPDTGTEDDNIFDDPGMPEEDAGEAPSAEADFTEISMEDFLDGGADLDDPAVDDSSLEEESSPAPAAGAPPPDLSTKLLMKIADELSSIRNELSTLKKEFSSIRGEASAEDHESAQRGGFFDEEDDEKIALTGDELDNILNTADFTEEAGSDATGPEAGDLSSADEDTFPGTDDLPSGEMLSGGEDIIGPESPSGEAASGEAEDFNIDLEFEENDLDELGDEGKVEEAVSLSDEAGIDSGEPDISLDDFSLEESAEPDFTADSIELKDHEELKQLREKGAEPMTPAPEDISYLEEDPLALGQDTSLNETPDDPMAEISLDDTAFDESSLDLSDAVIDEPDLSDQITENPLQEPSLDEISIDLDLEEDGEKPAGEDLSGEPEKEFIIEADEDIALEVPQEEEISEEEIAEEPPEIPEARTVPEEENFAQVIPEGFVVEAEDSQVPLEDDIEEDVFTEGELTAEPAAGETAETVSGEPEEGEQDILAGDSSIPGNIRQELKTVLSYMDQLLESLPEEKIEEFARSEYFDTYKKLFKELGLA